MINLKNHLKLTIFYFVNLSYLKYQVKVLSGLFGKLRIKKLVNYLPSKKFIQIVKAFATYLNAQRTYREVMILQQMSNSNQIIKLIKVFRAHNNKDLYLLFEYMQTDVRTLIYNEKTHLNQTNIRKIIYQICLGIKYLHSANFIHRDLKPANILINDDFTIKIGDFGFARHFRDYEGDQNYELTDFVASKWYRAPEVMLGSQHYSSAVDIWGIGCILAEIILKKPIFEGNTIIDQLQKIFTLFGKPKISDLKIQNPEAVQQLINNINIGNKKEFNLLFQDEREDTKDFLKGCLNVNPSKRITIDQILSHKYFSNQIKTIYGNPQIFNGLPSSDLDGGNKYSIKYYRDNIYKSLSHHRIKELQIHESQIRCNSQKNISISNVCIPRNQTENDQVSIARELFQNEFDNEITQISSNQLKKTIHPIRNTKTIFTTNLSKQVSLPAIENTSPKKRNSILLFNLQLPTRNSKQRINNQSTASQSPQNNQFLLPNIKKKNDFYIKVSSLEKDQK